MNTNDCVKSGSVISCPNNHRLYRTTADITRGMPMSASHVENIDATLPRVKAGQPVNMKCPHCQQAWRRYAGAGRWQVHFTTGWWPAYESADRERAKR